MHRSIPITAAVALIPVLAWIDYVTGIEANFFVFYFAPIGILAWFGGRGVGLAGALTCACLWFIVDHFGGHRYTHPYAGVWNAGIRLSAFVILAVATSQIRRDQVQLEILNQRMAETNGQLKQSLDRISALQRDIQTICAWTKRIKYEGRWIQFEEFLERQFKVRVSHGISEEAAAQLQAEIDEADPRVDPK